MDASVVEKCKQSIRFNEQAKRERLEMLHKRFPDLSVECIVKMEEELPHHSEVYRRGKGAP